MEILLLYYIFSTICVFGICCSASQNIRENVMAVLISLLFGWCLFPFALGGIIYKHLD